MLGLCVAIAATALGLGLSNHGGKSGSFAITSTPAAYVVLYQVVTNGVPQWEVLAAQRPFTGSDLTYRGATRPGPDAVAGAGTISTETGLYTEDNRGVRLVSGRQPGPPSADEWLGVQMLDAVARGLAIDTHRDSHVVGRRCHVFRFADPPSGPLDRIDLSVGHDDLCIDNAGLVLSEAWTYHGSVVQRRTAVLVSVDGSWPPSVPKPGATANALPGSSVAATVTPDATPQSVIASPPVPAGYRLANSPVELRVPDPQRPRDTVAATVVWAFVAGTHVITVEAGRERGGLLPWQDDKTVTAPAHLPNFPDATTALRSDGPEVRIPLSGGQWARVRGTVPLTELTAYAAMLRLR